MAIYHMSAKIVSRGGGGCAVASAAYRSGEKLKDLKNDMTHDYTKKQGIIYAEILTPDTAPVWALKREELWNKVEQAEKRKDAQLAREIEVALPIELDRGNQIELVKKYAFENFVSEGMIADIALHDKGDGNPHAHILLTTRTIAPEGFGQKARTWNDPQNLIRWRESWEDKTNEALRQAGSDERISCETLEVQGIDRTPQIHVGARANALPDSERKAKNQVIKDANAEREAVKASIGLAEKELEETEIGIELSDEGISALEREVKEALERTDAEERERREKEEADLREAELRAVISDGRAAARASYEAWKKAKAERQEQERTRQEEHQMAERERLERERKRMERESDRGGYSR